MKTPHLPESPCLYIPAPRPRRLLGRGGIARAATLAAALWWMTGLTGPTASAAVPIYQYEGKDLTVRVLAISKDETRVSGELLLAGKACPFSGIISEDEDEETVTGSYQDGDQAVRFNTREEGGLLIFNTTAGTYRLRAVTPTELKDAPVGPKEMEPSPAPASPTPTDNDATPAESPTKAGGPLKMRKVEFRDINMNNVVAYTMLVPEGWEARGHIEWSNDKTPYPQRKIQITAPDQSRISFIPAMTFGYSEATQVALRESAAMGIKSPIPPRQGDPPPEDLGAWLVNRITQVDKSVSKLRLVSDRRDGIAEAEMIAGQRALGQPVTGTWRIHLVTISFELGGVPFLQEINLTYVTNPPVRTRNIDMWNWMLFVNSDLRAPAAKFASLKPLMYAASGSLRSDPRWWTQQQLIIMEVTRQNHIIGMEEIRRRGEQLGKISDASFAEWKKKEIASDSAQNERINTINEVSDFRDTDGLPVKLPIHYQNYYSDGKGNYMMNNSSLNEPGSGWTKIETVK